MRVALLACVLVACGKGESTPPKKDDAGAAARDAAIVVIEPLKLGLPDLEAYGWRKRGGHPAFRVARTSEARQDWPTVVTTCRQALAADPGHLEAAWLLAAALGRQGKHEEILAPLQQAVAGDFGKWGHASLELTALASFRATPAGQAWTARVDSDRHRYLAALARSVVVESGGDLFAFDPETRRWHRLTRTYGAVVGALRVPAANKLVYVTRHREKGKRTYGIGTVELARGRTRRPVTLHTDRPLVISYQTKPKGVWIGWNKTWQRLDDNHELSALPAKTKRPRGTYLEVRGRKATLRALPVANVTADWDEHGLASAIRIGTSNRVVAVPSPGLIDGNSAVWSGDGARLAFVAQLTDECTPGVATSAAYVADAATGKPRELERATNGLAVEWVSDHELAIAGDRGVAIHQLGAGTSTPLAGATGLVAPRHRPHCVAAEPEPEPPDPEPEPDDDREVGPGVEPPDTTPR